MRRRAAVREGSPAARAGLKPGDMIRSVTLSSTPSGSKASEKKPKRKTLNLDGKEKEVGWPFVFNLIQHPAEGLFADPPDKAVDLTIGDGERKVTLVPEPDPDRYHPLRGLRFEYLRRPIPPKPLSASVREGAQATVENVTSIFFMFRGLYQGRLGKENFGGPIRIASMAYHFASSGLAMFIQFLGILNINLAVLNFLPIPPLDGGQMVFLVAEKVRSRPLPESVLSAFTIAGVVFVLGLMLFFIFQDVMLSFF